MLTDEEWAKIRENIEFVLAGKSNRVEVPTAKAKVIIYQCGTIIRMDLKPKA